METPIDDTGKDGAAVREDRSVSLASANIVMVLFAVPSVLLLAVPYLLFHDWRGLYYLTANPTVLLWLLLAITTGIFVHEGIHGVTWMLAAHKPRSAIRFGIHWKLITPYAHCTEAMRARAYRIGATMPLLVLGVVPSVLAWLLGSPSLLLFGLFFTFAAGGDMLILWTLRRVPSTAMVEDHPVRAGCLVIESAEQSA